MLFVYGTLQDADVLGAVLGRPVVMSGLRPAVAPGYRAVAYPGRVYPALVEAPNHAAPGLLIEHLSTLDMAVLDAFEGEEYRRQTIAVLAGPVQHRTEAYLPVVEIAATAADWSLAAWTATHKQNVLGQETGTAAALRERLSAQAPE